MTVVIVAMVARGHVRATIDTVEVTPKMGARGEIETETITAPCLAEAEGTTGRTGGEQGDMEGETLCPLPMITDTIFFPK